MSLALKYPPKYNLEDCRLWEGNWQLNDGVPYAMIPSPSEKHYSFASDLHYEIRKQLDTYSNYRVYIEFDWLIDDNTVVRPDLLIVCGSIEGSYLIFLPSLVIEILSPSSMKMDQLIKKELYASQGIRFYIIANPEEKTLQILELKEGVYIETEKSDLDFVEGCLVRFN